MLSDEFSKLKFGDVLWCVRENNHSRRIPGHDQGPYLYLYHDDDYVYALYGTKHLSTPYNKVFDLDEDVFSTDGKKMFKKKGSFYLKDIYRLAKENVKFKIGSLPEDKVTELSKNIRVNKPAGYEKIPHLINPSNNYLKEGDIFGYEGNIYIIISEEEDCLFGISVTINDCDNYDFNLEELEIFEKNITNYNYLGFLNESRIKKLKDACKVGENKDKELGSKASVGNVIICNGRTYYVSAVDSEFYLCYPLELSDFKNCDINCNKMYFKISFDQEIVRRDIKVDVCCSFSELDIKLIHSMKNERKKSCKQRIDPYAEARIKKAMDQRLRDAKYNLLSEKEIITKYFGYILHLFRKPDEMYFAYEVYRENQVWKIKCVKLSDFIGGIINIVDFDASDLVVSKVKLWEYIDSFESIPVNYANPIYNNIFMNQGLYKFVNNDEIKDEIKYIRLKTK